MIALDWAPYVAAAAVVAAPTITAVIAGVFSIKKQNNEQHLAGRLVATEAKSVSEQVLANVLVMKEDMGAVKVQLADVRNDVAVLDVKVASAATAAATAAAMAQALGAPNVVQINREEAQTKRIARV